MTLKVDYLGILKGVAWTCLAAGFMLLSAASVSSNETKEVRRVVYHLEHLTNGNDLITIEEIKEKILATYDLDLVGVEIERLDLEDLENILQEEAFIVDADAYVDAQNLLHIDISQRTPILRVMDRAGNNYYLDCEGVRLPLSNHFAARVPIVSGAVSAFSMHIDSTKGSLKEAFEIVKASRDDAFVEAWMEGIHVTNNQEILLNGNLGKFDVVFGKATNIQEKFEKLKIFFKSGLQITGWNDVQSINLKYADQVVASSRSKT